MNIKELIGSSALPKRFWGNVSEDVITNFEKEFNITFPKDYREFLTVYGSGSIGSLEIYGLGYPETGIPSLGFLLKNKYASDVQKIFRSSKSVPIANDGDFIYLIADETSDDFGKIAYFDDLGQKHFLYNDFTSYIKEYLE